MPNKNFKKLIIFLIFGLVVFVLDKTGNLNFLRKGMGNVFWSNGSESLEIEKKDCDSEIAKLEAEIARLKEENKSSRRLLGADVSPSTKFLTAHIVGFSGGRFRVDIGKNQGVEEGDIVVYEGMVFGKIDKVSRFFSQGITVLNNNFREAVEILNKDKDRVVARGILFGGDPPVVEEILAKEEVEEGDVVVAFEYADKFLAGKVLNVVELDDKIFKKAAVDWFINPLNIGTVFVAK